MTPIPQRPVHPEDRYQAELLSTEVTPRTARAMAWTFAALLAIVPLSQTAIELSRHQPLQVLDLFRPLGTALAARLHGDRGLARRALASIVSREFPKGFENSLEKASFTKQFFQPRLQALLTGLLRFGNDKGIVGRDGWLFYQPGVDYVAGPDFTGAATIALAAKMMIDKQGERDPHPDPRPALIALGNDAAAAGMHLVVVPIPDKAMLQPAQLTSRVSAGQAFRPANNRGYERFVAQVREGVDVFDPTPATVAPGETRYLAQDTHWTPAFMDEVAAGVARHLERWTGPAISGAANPFRLERMTVSRIGDLVDLLKLPPSQHIYLPQTVTVEQVIDRRTAGAWMPDPGAEVLLLGDSFTNVYSQPSMGWGSSAGFGEHLSYHLGRPIDVIAFNGGGASAVREELARRAASSPRGWPTKVIVYEFAIHQLAGQNWRPFAFKPPPAYVLASAGLVAHVEVPPQAMPRPPEPVRVGTPAVQEPPIVAGPATFVAEVLQTSKVPAPGTAPYKDCLTYIKLRVEQVTSGTLPATEIIGAFWAMKDNQWLPAASYAAGERLRVTVIPMEQADRQTQALQRADNLNDFRLKVFFVTSEARR